MRITQKQRMSHSLHYTGGFDIQKWQEVARGGIPALWPVLDLILGGSSKKRKSQNKNKKTPKPTPSTQKIKKNIHKKPKAPNFVSRNTYSHLYLHVGPEVENGSKVSCHLY